MVKSFGRLRPYAPDGSVIRFVSRNEHKIKEAVEILSAAGVEILAVKIPIEELQTDDPGKLVRDKTLKAFSQVGRPLFVEHTGLYLKQLNGLPGGLTQLFWDALLGEKFSSLFGKNSEPDVTAKTLVGYTDGKQFLTFKGEINGQIAPAPRGPGDFQWDCVFIPDGYQRTFAEMGEQKNKISMRRQALDKFARFLRGKVRR